LLCRLLLDEEGEIFVLMNCLLKRAKRNRETRKFQLFCGSMTHFCSVGDSSDTADPKILSLASAYSFSRCSRVLICGFWLCEEDKAGEESGRLRMVTVGFGRCRILGRKSSPLFDKIDKPFCRAAAISCSFLNFSCFSSSNRFSSWYGENIFRLRLAGCVEI
jgi:hypothetical protein